MLVLSLIASLAIITDLKRQLHGLSGELVTPITVGFTDPRCERLVELLGDDYVPTTDLKIADVFLGIDNEYSTANEYDLPLVSVDLTKMLLAWENEADVRKDSYIQKLTPVVTDLLRTIDPNPSREGLDDTPSRVSKAWAKWTEGYHTDIKDLLKVFEDGAEKCDEMVIVKDIPIYSKCEHHLADIFGTATIAYIPNGKIVGLSKLSRVADAFARRLQVQERLTNQIADALDEHLQPLGVAVIVRARHMCMESRGLCQQGHHTVTSALRGVLKDNEDTRAEFMTLANCNVNV